MGPFTSCQQQGCLCGSKKSGGGDVFILASYTFALEDTCRSMRTKPRLLENVGFDLTCGVTRTVIDNSNGATC